MRSILALILIAIISCTVSCIRDSNSKYPGIASTYESFANGRFVIADLGPIEGAYSLYDQEYKDKISYGHWSLDHDVKNYKEVSSYLYVVGNEGCVFRVDPEKESKTIYYTLVNLSTGEVRQEIDINEFSEEDRVIFNELENSEFVFDK